jgi:GDP-4-dehydro-6-deoxy-D-mannose reductase
VRILITGAGGFVGKHLTQHLLSTQPGLELHGTTLSPSARLDERITWHTIDLRDEAGVEKLITSVRPDHIYHLAAQASPRRSFEIPWETLENNIRAQLNVLLASIQLSNPPRIMVVTSAEIYGRVSGDELPITEETQLRPTNPYGVSKVAQDLLGWQYAQSHKLPIIRVRPFNHFGPGQNTGFVAVDFALQIARIEAGLQPATMRVGNLSGQRDFTDVRDVVRAYALLMEQGEVGEAYNVASGEVQSIQFLLHTLCELSRCSIEVKTDPSRFMPLDVPIILGTAAKLRQLTGWQPTIPFRQSLGDILDDCRLRTAQDNAS